MALMEYTVDEGLECACTAMRDGRKTQARSTAICISTRTRSQRYAPQAEATASCAQLNMITSWLKIYALHPPCTTSH